MNANQNSHSEIPNAHEVMTFQFSESKQEVRNLLIENKPWFIAKDVCNVLGLSKYRDAIRKLDDDERGSLKVDTLGGKQNMAVISQSGLYALILRSNKPQAKTFRKWITSEVIPSLLKKGYYSLDKSKTYQNVIDARTTPYNSVEINNGLVRFINIENANWFSINDYHAVINSKTSANQTAKKLNKLETLACKIWLFGATNPSWFTTEVGLQLIASGSKKIPASQLQLNLGI